MNQYSFLQFESSYHLFETLEALKSLKINGTVYTTKECHNTLINSGYSTQIKIITNNETFLQTKHQHLYNLSPTNTQKILFQQAQAKKKFGFYANDTFSDWQKYYIISHSGYGFLTFHLRDLIFNLISPTRPFLETPKSIRKNYLIVDQPHVEIVTDSDWKGFINQIHKRFDDVKIIELKNINEQKIIYNQALYLGPSHLKSLVLASKGTQTIHLTSKFQGLNLQPYGENHYLVHSPESPIEHTELAELISTLFTESSYTLNNKFNLYRLTNENIFGSFIDTESTQDPTYAFYLVHVVLWAFILGQYDVNLAPIIVGPKQVDVIERHLEIIQKAIKLKEYGLQANINLVQDLRSHKDHQKNLDKLIDVEITVKKLFDSFSLLKPMGDYYEWKKQDINSQKLSLHCEDHLLVLSEEISVLRAFSELLQMTLNYNNNMIKVSTHQG